MIKPIQSRYPETVLEAVGQLLFDLPVEQLDEIGSMREEDLYLLHPDLGMHIRHEFNLYMGNNKLMHDCAESRGESCSMVIIKALWQSLRRRNQ